MSGIAKYEHNSTMAQQQEDTTLTPETALTFDQEDKMQASETTHSSEDEYVEQSTPQQMTSLNGRTFHFEYDGFPWRNINIRRADGSMAYFADVSVFTRNVPDIKLLANSKDGLVVAAAYFRRAFSMTCGLGSDEASMDWIDMKRSGRIGSIKHQFEFNGSKYTLRRTKDVGPGVSGLSRVFLAHYEVVDDSSGNILASYSSQGSIGKRKGTLTLAEGVGQQLETLIVLGVAAWREKARRRHAAVGGGGGAGGP